MFTVCCSALPPGLFLQYCTDRKHLKPLWFCIVSCHLLWFTFTKAVFNVLFKKMVGRVVVFKSTKKKGEDDGRGDGKRRWFAPPRNIGDMEGTLDAWVLLLSFSISALTAIMGVFQIIDQPYTAQGQFRFFLALSIFWALYNMIPPALFIFYCYNKGQLFEDFCSFCMTLSFMVGIGGIVCTWLVPGGCPCGRWSCWRAAAQLAGNCLCMHMPCRTAWTSGSAARMLLLAVNKC